MYGYTLSTPKLNYFVVTFCIDKSIRNVYNFIVRWDGPIVYLSIVIINRDYLLNVVQMHLLKVVLGRCEGCLGKPWCPLFFTLSKFFLENILSYCTYIRHPLTPLSGTSAILKFIPRPLFGLLWYTLVMLWYALVCSFGNVLLKQSHLLSH